MKSCKTTEEFLEGKEVSIEVQVKSRLARLPKEMPLLFAFELYEDACIEMMRDRMKSLVAPHCASISEWEIGVLYDQLMTIKRFRREWEQEQSWKHAEPPESSGEAA